MIDKSQHTSREFERELRDLRERVLAMGGRAESALQRAVEAVVRGDLALADQVIADDARIDADEIAIDELAFLILARRQPVASDLRFVMFALKVVTDLERVGDLGVNIAKRARQLSRLPPAPVLTRIGDLAQKVLAALRGALDAFAVAEAERAEAVIAGDAEIDRLNTEVIGELLAHDRDEGSEPGRTLALSSISRYLERAGDHATNIAEMVIYYLRGRDVRHHRGG